MLTSKLLRNGVLDFDRLHGFGQIGERVAPTTMVSELRLPSFEVQERLPFGWGNDFDDPGFHAVFVDLVDESSEVAKLVHCLQHQAISNPLPSCANIS